MPAETQEELVTVDDTLDLFFLCCHPSLSSASATALTLRAVGGLTTREIARAFLVPEATMAQRLSRARQTIRESGIPFETPDAAERTDRRAAVTRTLYLIFSEGYVASAGAELQRIDLSAEAIRLSRLLHRLSRADPEVMGLFALMLLTDARREARTDAAGALIPLDAQDRSRWNGDAIAEGTALVTSAFASGAVGPYQLQAAIASLHDEASSNETTDWPQILALYGELLRMSDNPMVALSHAIALAMVNGPEATPPAPRSETISACRLRACEKKAVGASEHRQSRHPSELARDGDRRLEQPSIDLHDRRGVAKNAEKRQVRQVLGWAIDACASGRRGAFRLQARDAAASARRI